MSGGDGKAFLHTENKKKMAELWGPQMRGHSMVWSLAVERVAGKQTGTGSLGMDYQRVCMSFYLLII